jgi:hypothetical protein
MVNSTGRAPSRTRHVFFAGAGLSCAFGLPNTAALLSELSHSAGKVVKGPSDTSLKEAFKAFYPDGDKRHFLPDTVDFFSSLQAFIDIGAPGMPGIKLKSADELLRQLKLGITRLLVDRIKAAESDGRLTISHPYLNRMVSPGNVIITTNWDLLVERYAALKGVDVRRTGEPGDSYVLLLKLHGSIDWCEWGLRKPRSSDPSEDFAQLREVTRKVALPSDGESDVVRVRAVEHWSRCWQRISGRTSEPFLVTMYRGKGPELASLSTVWTDAYHALGRAKTLEIVGYSLPDDDLEIRTLLRAGLNRGNQSVQVTVRNPAPDVHARIRRHVKISLSSDYSAV